MFTIFIITILTTVALPFVRGVSKKITKKITKMITKLITKIKNLFINTNTYNYLIKINTNIYNYLIKINTNTYNYLIKINTIIRIKIITIIRIFMINVKKEIAFFNLNKILYLIIIQIILYIIIVTIAYIFYIIYKIQPKPQIVCTIICFKILSLIEKKYINKFIPDNWNKNPIIIISKDIIKYFISCFITICVLDIDSCISEYNNINDFFAIYCNFIPPEKLKYIYPFRLILLTIQYYIEKKKNTSINN